MGTIFKDIINCVSVLVDTILVIAEWSGWRVELLPSCPASQHNFDIIVGADGKSNSLPGD